MARKKLTPFQIGFFAIIWIAFVVYILFNAKITGGTIISIIFSGAIVFIPIYKSLKK